ncbi:ATP-binding protein [Glutamicibacter ardleyensis]|uniref:ATP-binding protein n=1 Tax=Glutamicibacter ardleyensis TaxID=225894 RepID=UPI003FCF631A
MNDIELQSTVETFRPRARLLQLLGDQLIGSPRLALFELVKNAYDADAANVSISMKRLDNQSSAEIIVQDDGEGMSIETLRDIWLVPGHDHKALMRAKNSRTPKGRLPLGEKGVGRFAVHKLGNEVEVVTRKRGARECVMSIDWSDIANAEFLDAVRINIDSRTPAVFEGSDHGTRVRVSNLRGNEWTRGDVRRLARQITSISSPFSNGPSDFAAAIVIEDQPKWLEDLPDTTTIIESAPWEFEFNLCENIFEWQYKFKGIPGVKLNSREIAGRDTGLLLNAADLPEGDLSEFSKLTKIPKAIRSTMEMMSGIGSLSGKFYVFDRDKELMAKMGRSQSVQTFLDESGGMRVYRDGIRVYNYGEPGDDWLGLDLRRVNSPSKRVSNNIIIGSIALDLESSQLLVEKTNREGFVENDALTRLRALILGAVNTFEAERNKDKNSLRKLLTKEKSALGSGIDKTLSKIKVIAKNNGFYEEISPLVDRANQAYNDMRDIMLRAGVSGMSLVIVYHEIDHGVRLLQKMAELEGDPEKIHRQARDLVSVLDSFGDMIRRGATSSHDIRKLARRAADLSGVRLDNHDICFEFAEDESVYSNEMIADIPFGLVMGAITNIIDNSIYWISARWPDSSDSGSRKIYMRVDPTLYQEGPTLIIADNGPGLADDLSDAVEPFFTRRPDGIGVGLYYTNLIMETIGGALNQLSNADAAVPPEYDGTILALSFRRN